MKFLIKQGEFLCYGTYGGKKDVQNSSDAKCVIDKKKAFQTVQIASPCLPDKTSKNETINLTEN